MKYSTAGAFRQALEERLRQQALETDIAMFRERTPGAGGARHRGAPVSTTEHTGATRQHWSTGEYKNP